MPKPDPRIVLILTVFLGLACGGGDADENARVDMEAPADPMAEATDAVRGAMEQMGMGSVVEQPLDFRELARQLPEELGGLPRTRNEGQTSGAMGMNVSVAEAVYETEDGGTITVSITDIGAVAGPALMGMVGWADMEIDRETDSGYERTTEYEGYPAFEQFSAYDGERGSAEVAFLIEQRFIVGFDGERVTMEQVKQLRDDLDVDALADLKDRSGGG